MKICFGSNAYPWFFGPYGKQLKILCEYFIKKHDVYYLHFSEKEAGIIDYKKFLDTNDIGNINSDNDELFSKIKFIGGIKMYHSQILSSNINSILKTHNIDKFVFLSDLSKICFDHHFSCDSFTWFPNHFNPINTENKNKLSYFNNIISLCETDKQLLMKTFPEKNIYMIPHIIDIHSELTTFNKDELRKHYKFNKNDFIIFMNVGNYEIHNRKSLDTAIFAFNDFVKKYSNAMLFIHTYDVRKLDVYNKYTPKQNFFEISSLLKYLDIPSDRIRVVNDILSDKKITEYYLLSDMYLQTSKTEGFGLPVLEAQKLGLPVVTTKFGAMNDYTFNGISVEPCQKLYESALDGIWCTPSIQGVYDALCRIYNNDYENNTQRAIEYIETNMSSNTVCKHFEKIFKAPHGKLVKNNKQRTISIIYYDGNKYYLDGLSYDKIFPNMLNSKWVIFLNKNIEINHKTLILLCEKNNDRDLVLVQTQFKNKIYPTEIDLKMGNINIEQMNYIIKSEFVKPLIHLDLLNQYMSGFILQNNLNTNRTFVNNVFCIEK